jgi:hypothetical protein
LLVAQSTSHLLKYLAEQHGHVQHCTLRAAPGQLFVTSAVNHNVHMSAAASNQQATAMQSAKGKA